MKFQKDWIPEFSGKYNFLSNFSDSPIKYEGIVYPTVEHAFQAAKTLNINKRLEIAHASTPGQAKRLGRSVKLRSDWEEIKVDIMRECLRLKFEIPELREALLETGNAELTEGNTWHDNFWGICYCSKCRASAHGKNVLGLLLMEVRDEIRRKN